MMSNSVNRACLTDGAGHTALLLEFVVDLGMHLCHSVIEQPSIHRHTLQECLTAHGKDSKALWVLMAEALVVVEVDEIAVDIQSQLCWKFKQVGSAGGTHLHSAVICFHVSTWKDCDFARTY